MASTAVTLRTVPDSNREPNDLANLNVVPDLITLRHITKCDVIRQRDYHLAKEVVIAPPPSPPPAEEFSSKVHEDAADELDALSPEYLLKPRKKRTEKN
ncbi:hypothetical protein LTR50_007599 [Elasticomyces elasticus]|nr:hypothetical protein LTR50_007599 [Elasticomyces elasticus]